MEFSRQEYWSGLPFPSGDRPEPGISPGSPALQVNSLLFEPPGKPLFVRRRKSQGSSLLKTYCFKKNSLHLQQGGQTTE